MDDCDTTLTRRIEVMTGTIRKPWVALAVAGVLLGSSVMAVAENCTLTLKRRETKANVFDATSYMKWTVQPQYFSMQMTAEATGRWRVAGSRENTDAFKRLVRKEPKYVSEHPYRGVIKLGTQEYAFALDAVPPTAEAKKPDAPDSKKATKKSAEKTGSLTAALADLLGGGTATADKSSATVNKASAKPSSIKEFEYNRLYLDINHNGDLADDNAIVIPSDPNRSVRVASPGMTYWPFEFPRIDVPISVDGTKVEHSFFVNGYVYSSANNCSISVSISSAVCREGDITLEGKRHHIVLIDFNSNGRFDDKYKISENIHLASGQLYAETGDMLLVDPQPGGSDSPYDPTSSSCRYYLSEMAPIDGRWYNVKVSPTGDQLTLTASMAATGNVTNGNESFGALIYSSDKGFVKVRGTKDKPIAIPEGQWKLYSYTITKEPPKLADRKPDAKPAQVTLLEGLAELLGAGGAAGLSPTGPSVVSATATEKYKPVTVRKGETVEMPFGPPYTPTVTAAFYGTPDGRSQQTFLEMTLIGVAGEACSNMTVKGNRPGKPAFTITDPEGKVVEQGSFEYG
jgi:hypothetical protein